MKPYQRITLVYAIFGVLWIFCSDQLAEILASNIKGFSFLQTMKGWLFVGLSSVLLLVVNRQAFKQQRQVEQEKLAVFQKTVEGSYHILLNYLNQMQLVTIEAEQCKEFDRQILKIASDASDEATKELKRLGDIQTITAENIDAVVYQNIRHPDASRK